MPGLVNSKFDEDLIENDQVSLETPFSHYKYGKFLRCSRAPNSEESGPIWRKFELVQDFMSVLLTCKSDEVAIKTEGVRVETLFPTKFSLLKGKLFQSECSDLT